MKVSNAYSLLYAGMYPYGHASAVDGVGICRYFSRHKNTYLQIPAQWWATLMSLCATMCRYFCKKYLHTLRQFLRRFLRCCIAICAVASPSHRRIASAPHRVATVAWQLHWNYNCQWCHRLVARGLKKWSLDNSGL